MNHPHRSLCLSRVAQVLLGILVLATLPTPVWGQGEGLEAALKRYRQFLARKPFTYHTLGRQALADTRTPDALDILIKDYDKPHAYPEFTRYTLATMLGENFFETSTLDALAGLRARHHDPADAWMWIKTLAISVQNGKSKSVLDIAVNGKDLYQRAAAIVAMAENARLDLLPHFVELVGDLPKKDGPRRLWIAALSTAIFANRYNLYRPAMTKALRGYIGLLDPRLRLTRSAKIVIARHLGRIFSSKTHSITPAPWLRILADGATASKTTSGSTSVQLRFFGIEAKGDRICYVIDMSDSMCKEVDTGRRRDGGATTGGGSARRKANRRAKGYVPDETDIPWHRIRTRFDLAREHLKISIQRLPKTKRFCVLWFGTEAGRLESCSGMIKATHRNVKRVLDELDRIVPGPPELPKSPDGQLRGRTNLHSGLRLAFSLRATGFAKEHEYVDMKAMTQGADTIFLLSDGAPSWDGFAKEDRDYGDKPVVHDPEYNKATSRTPTLTYHGPYHRAAWIEEDMRRMNVFRKLQVHCIAIGEADISLLEALAEDSMGEVFVFRK